MRTGTPQRLSEASKAAKAYSRNSTTFPLPRLPHMKAMGCRPTQPAPRHFGAVLQLRRSLHSEQLLAQTWTRNSTVSSVTSTSDVLRDSWSRQ